MKYIKKVSTKPNNGMNNDIQDPVVYLNQDDVYMTKLRFDLNKDGIVDSKDINELINAVLTGDLSEDKKVWYDIDNNGEVDVTDVTNLITVFVGEGIRIERNEDDEIINEPCDFAKNSRVFKKIN